MIKMEQLIYNWVTSVIDAKYHKDLTVKIDEGDIAMDDEKIFEHLFDLVSTNIFNYDITLHTNDKEYKIDDAYLYEKDYFMLVFSVTEKDDIYKCMFKIHHKEFDVKDHIHNLLFEQKYFGLFTIRTFSYLDPQTSNIDLLFKKYKDLFEYLAKKRWSWTSVDKTYDVSTEETKSEVTQFFFERRYT